MKEYPMRKALRLKGWDYTANGVYFITFCTQGRLSVLSSIRRGDLYGRPPLTLTGLGMCVDQAISEVARRTGVRMEHQVIMPNHVHLLMLLDRAARAEGYSVGRIVGAIKSRAVCLARAQGLPAAGLWQRGYHDHIIRTDEEFRRIWTYVDHNPLKWELDEYYTE